MKCIIWCGGDIWSGRVFVKLCLCLVNSVPPRATLIQNTTLEWRLMAIYSEQLSFSIFQNFIDIDFESESLQFSEIRRGTVPHINATIIRDRVMIYVKHLHHNLLL